MIFSVRTYINKHHLLHNEKPVLVGLSGGADSVALLSVLMQLNYSCIAAHCNFHLRGEESNRDEAFAEDFAKKLDIPFYKTDFDTNVYAEKNHISVEMAARELRYKWFEEIRQITNSQAVAVAHHRDDTIETVLLNLVRGTGIRGLRGMRPKNGFIVRPLLNCSREEILLWLDEHKISYVTDSTNLSDEYKRNFIRLRVLPLLEEINPSAREAVCRTSEHLSSVEKIYQSVIDKARNSVFTDNNRLSIRDLLKYPSPETILYELLLPYNFSRVLAEEVFRSLNKESGKVFFSSTHRLIKDRDFLLFSTVEERKPLVCEIVPAEGLWSGPLELFFEKTVMENEFLMKKEKQTAYFDYDKLTFPLTLRQWNPGDWFIPFGMKGKKKLSDYFSDHKFSLADKEKTWLLCSGNDIIWIVGERSDDRFRITKTTSNILIVNFLGEKVSGK